MRTRFTTAGLLLLAACTAKPISDPPEEIRAKLTSQIAEMVKDPDANRFQWYATSVKNKNVYCGRLNAKNALGGYTGFAPFVATYTNGRWNGAPSILLSSDGDAAAFIADICIKAGYAIDTAPMSDQKPG